MFPIFRKCHAFSMCFVLFFLQLHMLYHIRIFLYIFYFIYLIFFLLLGHIGQCPISFLPQYICYICIYIPKTEKAPLKSRSASHTVSHQIFFIYFFLLFLFISFVEFFLDLLGFFLDFLGFTRVFLGFTRVFLGFTVVIGTLNTSGVVFLLKIKFQPLF